MQTPLPRMVITTCLAWLIGVPGFPLLGALLGLPELGYFVLYWVFPWVFVAGSITMAVSFHARRHRGRLTKTSRGDHRFAAVMAAGGTLRGLDKYGILTLAIGIGCWLATLVPTSVPHVPLGQLPVEGEPDA